jgi:hypothetical protein
MMIEGSIFTPAMLAEFIKSVSENERHFLSEKNLSFLDALYESSKSRMKVVPQGSIYYRARVNAENPHFIVAPENMLPIAGLRSEGRVNPYNVNALYMANKIEVAVAEVRPSLYEPATVATLKTNQDLRLVDFTKDRPDFYWYFFGFTPKNKEEAESFTWVEINGYFSKPLSPNEARLNYIPTQIISEFLKSKGYDGVVYQSQFEISDSPQQEGSLNENIALFDLGAVDVIETKQYSITKQLITVKKFR